MHQNRRIVREFQSMKNSEVELLTQGIQVIPNLDGTRFFYAIIMGPVGTPYEGGFFRLKLELMTSYPFRGPKIKFASQILHVNIDRDNGYISGLDILADKWTPALQIINCLTAIRCLIETPNPDSCLNPELAKLMKTDPEKYNEKVREHTYLHGQL